MILHRLIATREASIREEQAGFRPGRGCIDHIFTLHQILEQRHANRRPTILVFLDFKDAFDSVDRLALLNVLAQQDIPLKFVKIIRSLYSQTQGLVRAYGELSKSFPTTSGVLQGCPLSPFLFKFVIDEIMKQTRDVGWVMFYACLTTVDPRKLCFPYLIQTGGSLAVARVRRGRRAWDHWV